MEVGLGVSEITELITLPNPHTPIHVHLEHVNVSLFGSQTFADAIELR